MILISNFNGFQTKRIENRDQRPVDVMQLLFYFIYSSHLFSILLHLFRRRGRNSISSHALTSPSLSLHLLLLLVLLLLSEWIKKRPINFFILPKKKKTEKRNIHIIYWLIIKFFFPPFFRLFLLLDIRFNLIQFQFQMFVSFSFHFKALIRSRE